MEKEDVTLSNKGYVLIDSLVAAAIIMMLIYTIIPIASLLTHEKEFLSEKRHISTLLYDEMQLFITNQNSLPAKYDKKFREKTISFHFDHQNEAMIKGCVTWENMNERKEEFCLYGTIFE